MVQAHGQSILQSVATAERFVVAPSELHWRIGDRGDKRIGNEVYHVAEVERVIANGKVVSCKWTIAEFPPGAMTHVGHHSIGCVLVENFRFRL